MNDIASEIGKLFAGPEVATDPTGSLAAFARLLEQLEPSLLMFAEAGGDLLATEDFGSGEDLKATETLATEVLQHLPDAGMCLFERSTSAGVRLAFGMALSYQEQQGILAGLLPNDPATRSQFEARQTLLAAGGELAWQSYCTMTNAAILETRVRQLQREQDTLKGAHSEVMANAMEEHEERLRQQHEQMALREFCSSIEAANEAKNQFLANISHELRTPLHGILSFASFGLKKAQGPNEDDLRRYFQKIETSGNLLLGLVNDLLDLAKLEAGRMNFEFAETNLRALVYSVVDEFSSLAEHRNIKINFSHHGPDGPVTADGGKLMQVVRNLLSNAVKFSPDGGTIHVDLQRNDQAVLVSVCDEGRGIPEDELEAVFEKFVQSKQNDKSAGGTGLGLSICREIITAHQGRIWAENRPDAGAMFTFVIPLDPTQTPTADDTGEASD